MLQTDIFYRFNFNLNFIGDLSLTAGKELNVKEATISSQNINQEGLDTSKITTKEVKKEEIKPQYGDIAKGAAITGAIAGATVVAGSYLDDYMGGKTDGVKDPNAYYKPDPKKMLKDPEFAAKVKALNPNYKGVWDPNSLNMGSANLTTNIEKVGTLVDKPTTFLGHLEKTLNEGSWFMKPIETTFDGMHNMSIFHDMWGEPNNLVGKILGSGGVNQLTIFVPGIPLSYCTMYPAACAGVVGNQFNNSKPENNIIINKPIYEKPF